MWETIPNFRCVDVGDYQFLGVLMWETIRILGCVDVGDVGDHTHFRVC